MNFFSYICFQYYINTRSMSNKDSKSIRGTISNSAGVGEGDRYSKIRGASSIKTKSGSKKEGEDKISPVKSPSIKKSNVTKESNIEDRKSNFKLRGTSNIRSPGSSLIAKNEEEKVLLEILNEAIEKVEAEYDKEISREVEIILKDNIINDVVELDKTVDNMLSDLTEVDLSLEGVVVDLEILNFVMDDLVNYICEVEDTLKCLVDDISLKIAADIRINDEVLSVIHDVISEIEKNEDHDKVIEKIEKKRHENDNNNGKSMNKVHKTKTITDKLTKKHIKISPQNQDENLSSVKVSKELGDVIPKTYSKKSNQVVTLPEYPVLVTLFSNPEMYSWGCGDNGNLGLGYRTNQRNEPTKMEEIKFDSPINQIAAGYVHSIFTTESGKSYIFGDGTVGQIGNGKEFRLTTPMQIIDSDHLALGNTVSVACGGLSSYVVTGGVPPKLYSKAIYLKELIFKLKEYLIENPTLGKVREQIDIQQSHLSNIIRNIQKYEKHEGYVFSWGGNKDGQLGLNDQLQRVSPNWIRYLRPYRIVEVSAGVKHVMVRSKDGEVLIF